MSRCPHLRHPPKRASVNGCPIAPASAGPRRTGSASVFRGAFAYVDAHLPDGEIMPPCRLRYGGSASIWGFAIYRASHDDYQDSFLPTGHATGSPKKPSTAPAASTSANPPHGSKPSPIHRRTNDHAH